MPSLRMLPATVISESVPSTPHSRNTTVSAAATPNTTLSVTGGRSAAATTVSPDASILGSISPSTSGPVSSGALAVLSFVVVPAGASFDESTVDLVVDSSVAASATTPPPAPATSGGDTPEHRAP